MSRVISLVINVTDEIFNVLSEETRSIFRSTWCRKQGKTSSQIDRALAYGQTRVPSLTLLARRSSIAPRAAQLLSVMFCHKIFIPRSELPIFCPEKLPCDQRQSLTPGCQTPNPNEDKRVPYPLKWKWELLYLRFFFALIHKPRLFQFISDPSVYIVHFVLVRKNLGTLLLR